MIIRKHLKFYGSVQGVGFRDQNKIATIDIIYLDRNYKYDKLINEDKPLPVLARGWPHFLYLKTAATLSLDTIIKSTDEGNRLLNLSSIARLTPSRLTGFLLKSSIIPPGLSCICRSPLRTALSMALVEETSFKSQNLSCHKKSAVFTLS